MINIYVDGSGVENFNILQGYGWGLYIPKLAIERSGKLYEEDASVTRSEMVAALEALKMILTLPKDHYVIYSDNVTVYDGFNGVSSRKSHKDIWRKIYHTIREIRKTESTFEVRRYERDHTKEDFPYAQKVDQLAYQAANRLY